MPKGPEEKKQYAITQEIADINTEYLALCELMDRCIKFNVRYKKLLRVSLDAQTKRNEFWSMVRGLHSEVYAHHKMCYDAGELYVTEVD